MVYGVLSPRNRDFSPGSISVILINFNGNDSELDQRKSLAEIQDRQELYP